MIARVLPQPEPEPERREVRTGTRSGRTASSDRHARARRERYAPIAAVVGALAVATAFVLAFLLATVEGTELNIDVVRAHRDAQRLADGNAERRAQIDRLSDPARLLAIARRLGMRAETSALVVRPSPAPAVAQQQQPFGILPFDLIRRRARE